MITNLLTKIIQRPLMSTVIVALLSGGGYYAYNNQDSDDWKSFNQIIKAKQEGQSANKETKK